MCNLWTNEHVFIWAGNTANTAVENRPLAGLVCRCGAFRYDGKVANLTSDKSIEHELKKELKLIYVPRETKGE